ncbi:MAG: signal peptidase I [Firmicutes bacterium]|nr:signal peptidase I [Bacillota bacterium]
MNKNLLISLIVIILLAGFHALLFVWPSALVTSYFNLVRPAVYIAAALVVFFTMGGRYARPSVRNNTFLICAIAALLYITILFFAGIFGGFGKNAMAPSFKVIARNAWSYGAAFLLMEYIRITTLRRVERKYVGWLGLLMTLCFAFIQINNPVYYFGPNANVAETISLVVMPALLANFFLTYAAEGGTLGGLLIFRAAVTLVPVLVPILPVVNKFLLVIILCAVVIVGYILLDKYRFDEKQKKSLHPEKYRWKGYLIPAAFLAVLIMFGAGVFPFAPVAVVSNSMKSSFERGSIVVVRKIEQADVEKTVKEGEVIQYNSGRVSVVHRVIEIRQDNLGETIYITKGDDNNAADSQPVYAEQITGVAKFAVPYAGYPAVWLRELFNR